MKARFILLLFFILNLSMVKAQNAGDIDPTFNPTDIGFGIDQGANISVSSAALQADGKVIVCGFFTSFNGIAFNRILRLNSDGSIDNTFDPGMGADNAVNGIVVQPDGKILIRGSFTSYDGISRNGIARINADGTLDIAFNPGAGGNGSVEAIRLQSDGKLIIAGFFSSYDGTARNGIARLNTNGSLDTSFDPGQGASFIYSAAIQSDDKVIIVGSFTSYDGTSRNKVARINIDGSLDTSFDPGTGVQNAQDRVFSAVIQTDGKIIIAGEFVSFDGTTRNNLARINTNGTLDIGFDPGAGPNNTSGFGIGATVAIQTDGKLIVSGAFTEFNSVAKEALVRLNPDGSVDASFNPGEEPHYSREGHIQPDGKIITVGFYETFSKTVISEVTRINADGSHDPTFITASPSDGANNLVESLAIQPDKKIIIVGGFTGYNKVARARIARLNVDGTLDTSFEIGTGADGSIIRVGIQSDGKLVVGGNFTVFNGVSRVDLVRLNVDGSVDLSFDPGLGTDIPNGFIRPTVIQPDGKIIIGGNFVSYNGVARSKIARVNPDGSLDTSFDPGTGLNSLVESIALQPDGKIIAAGFFTLFNGVTRNRIVRINSDGTLDTSFDPGSGAGGGIRSVTTQHDGKILINGDFTSFDGIAINRIARLNSDGSLDLGFNPGTGANNRIQSQTIIQPDGKILIGGQFTTYDGIARNRIARLNSNGSLDTSFDPGTGAENTVFSLGFQSSDELIIGGTFLSYNGVGKNRVARVFVNVNSVSIADSLALVSFYNATGGPDWTAKTNWLTGPVTTWAGVTFTGPFVTALSLPNNNISGSIPSDFVNLANLTSLDLSENEIISIPNLTFIPGLTSVNLSDNKLNFASLEQNASLIGFNYGNQALLGDSTETLVDVGENFSLEANGGGASDEYQWLRNGTTIPGATQRIYEIVSINRASMGDYICHVTNPNVPGLTLSTALHRVLATATISGRLLVNESTGASSGQMTLFKITTGAYDTTAVNTINPDGTYLFEKIILDDYQLLGFADTLAHVDALPTYFERTVYWEEADTLAIENNIAALDIISTFKPAPPKNGVGEISGIFSEEVAESGGRVLRNQRIRNAGASLRRVERTSRGNEVILTLVAYTFTNDVGEFLFNKLDPGEYLLNLQYPGYPMDPESFINIIIGTGLLDKQVGVEAQVIDGKIVVRKRIITGWLETNSPYRVYPNPANDWLYVKNKTGSSRGLSVSARDYNGRTIEIPLKYDSLNDEWVIDVGNLPFGGYLLRVGEGKNYQMLRVMIVH